MILDEGEDDKGKFFKSGLISRYALTLENYASSDWGERFYSPNFLQGFCERRREIHDQVTKGAGSLLLTTTLLAFFDSVQGEMSFWGMTIAVPELAALALCVLVSLNWFVLVGLFVDQLIIDRFLGVLGERIGAYSFEIALIDLTAKNLWINALVPKFYGLASGPRHKFVSTGVNFLFLPLGLAFAAYPTIIVCTTVLSAVSNKPDFVTVALSVIACFVLFLSFLIILAFCIKYQFRPSGLSEPADPYIPKSFMEMGHPRSKAAGNNSDDDFS